MKYLVKPLENNCFKTIKHNKFLYKTLMFFMVFVCLQTSGFSKGLFGESNVSYYPNDSITDQYRRILNGLNLSYVRYYSKYKSGGGNLVRRGWPEIDPSFKHDSSLYWACYKEFFNQDRRFLEWLLTFRKDRNHADLWKIGHDPRNSYLGEWYFNWNNSRAAITLIFNFLDGYGFRFYESATYNWQQCTKEQYKIVKKFLKSNKTNDINILRKEWTTYEKAHKYVP